MKSLWTFLVATSWVMHCADATFLPTHLGPVGYNLDRKELDLPSVPHIRNDLDTRTIAPRGPREAQLVCDLNGVVHRVVTCEIHTYDICGNRDGLPGNITDWERFVYVDKAQLHSSLVSPIIWLKKSVARFYFTPRIVGLHRIELKRTPSSIMPALRTRPSMSFYVNVRDILVPCTSVILDRMNRQTQHYAWTQSSFENELTPIHTRETFTNQPTRVFGDRISQFGASNLNTFQQVTGRAASQPFIAPPLADMPRTDDNRFKFCEWVARTSQTKK